MSQASKATSGAVGTIIKAQQTDTRRTEKHTIVPVPHGATPGTLIHCIKTAAQQDLTADVQSACADTARSRGRTCRGGARPSSSSSTTTPTSSHTGHSPRACISTQTSNVGRPCRSSTDFWPPRRFASSSPARATCSCCNACSKRSAAAASQMPAAVAKKPVSTFSARRGTSASPITN